MLLSTQPYRFFEQTFQCVVKEYIKPLLQRRKDRSLSFESFTCCIYFVDFYNFKQTTKANERSAKQRIESKKPEKQAGSSSLPRVSLYFTRMCSMSTGELDKEVFRRFLDYKLSKKQNFIFRKDYKKLLYV